MARIPAGELARIKREVSLLALIQQQGHAVTRLGKDHAIHCPFHEQGTRGQSRFCYSQDAIDATAARNLTSETEGISGHREGSVH